MDVDGWIFFQNGKSVARHRSSLELSENYIVIEWAELIELLNDTMPKTNHLIILPDKFRHWMLLIIAYHGITIQILQIISENSRTKKISMKSTDDKIRFAQIADRHHVNNSRTRTCCIDIYGTANKFPMWRRERERENSNSKHIFRDVKHPKSSYAAAATKTTTATSAKIMYKFH